MPIQRVVAPPPNQQKYSGAGGNTAGDFAGGAGGGSNFAMMGALEETIEDREVQRAVEAFEELDERQVEIFKAYFAGDAKTSEEGAV